MHRVVAAIVLFGSLTWSAVAAGAETWFCHVDRDAVRSGPIAEDETITVDGAEAVLSTDPAMRFAVGRNDDETLVASFLDFGGKPPIATFLTVIKHTGEYAHVKIEGQVTLRSATGRCVRD